MARPFQSLQVHIQGVKIRVNSSSTVLHAVSSAQAPQLEQRWAECKLWSAGGKKTQRRRGTGMQGKCCRHIAEGEMYIVTHTAGEAVGAAAVVAFWYRCISRQSWSVRTGGKRTYGGRLSGSTVALLHACRTMGQQNTQTCSAWAGSTASNSISGRRLLEELPADQDAPDLCGGRGSIASA